MVVLWKRELDGSGELVFDVCESSIVSGASKGSDGEFAQCVFGAFPNLLVARLQ